MEFTTLTKKTGSTHYGATHQGKSLNEEPLDKEKVSKLQDQIRQSSDRGMKCQLLNQFIDSVLEDNKDTSQINGEFLKLSLSDAIFHQNEKVQSFVIGTIIPSIKKSLEQSTDNWDLNAIYKLGVAYKRGDIVEANLDDAIKYLKDAADQGHIKAAFILAQILAEKQRMKTWSDVLDFQPGIIKYYKIAADGGYPGAASLLAYEYELMRTKEGHALAYSYYEMGKRDGHVQATAEIDCYIPKRAQRLFKEANRLWESRDWYNSNASEAIKLYEMAAEFKHPGAIANLNTIKSSR